MPNDAAGHLSHSVTLKVGIALVRHAPAKARMRSRGLDIHLR
jgi:hypothetical protein